MLLMTTIKFEFNTEQLSERESNGDGYMYQTFERLTAESNVKLNFQ